MKKMDSVIFYTKKYFGYRMIFVVDGVMSTDCI